MKRNQVTIAMLIFVAAELNTLLFAGDKEIPEDKTVGEDVIIAKIKEAAEQLVAEDTLTPKTTGIMKALEIVAGPIKPEMKVDKDEEAAEETGESTLLSQVEDAVELKELRLLVKNESEFESLRKTLNSHKEVEGLREAMLSILNVPATDGAEEKVEKKDEKKEVPAKGDKKEEATKPVIDKPEKVKKGAVKKSLNTPRSVIFAKVLKDTKTPVSKDKMLAAFDAEYKGSSNVSKFYIKTITEYLNELGLITVTEKGILLK